MPLLIGVALMGVIACLNLYGIGGADHTLFRRQVVLAVIGLVVMVAVSLTNYRHLKNHTLPVLVFYGISFALLASTLFFSEIRNIRAWIQIGGFQFEPSELMKLGGARAILATAPDNKAISAVLGGLGVNRRLMIVGVSDEPMQVPSIPLILGRRSIMGWPSGTPITTQEALSFSQLTGVRAMTEVFPLERAAEAYDSMISGKVRFRAVLTTAS